MKCFLSVEEIMKLRRKLRRVSVYWKENDRPKYKLNILGIHWALNAGREMCVSMAEVVTIAQTYRFCYHMIFVYFVNNNAMRTALSTFEFVTVYIHIHTAIWPKWF